MRGLRGKTFDPTSSRRPARATVAAFGVAGALTLLLAACFPDYEIGGGDAASGADSSTMADGPVNGDSTTASDSRAPADDSALDGALDAITADGAPPGDSGAGDTSAYVDTGAPSLDGSFYDGAVPTGMTLFQPGAFQFTVYTADNGGWDAAVNATATLEYAFAIDTTEVTASAFQGWLDAGLPAPNNNTSLDPGGPFATVMVWKGQWTGDFVDDAGAYEGPGCSNTGGVAATLPRGVGSYPVSCVNWFQAQAFCAWKGKRLPTDTEWRVAATSGGHEPYPWGSTNPTTCAYVTGDVASPTNCGFPLSVGSANSGGTATTPPVFDLVGSLDEWMWDFIYPNGYGYPANARNFSGPAQTSQTDIQRQYFGGCYYDNGGLLQNWQPGATAAGADQGYDNTGFRCAKTL